MMAQGFTSKVQLFGVVLLTVTFSVVKLNAKSLPPSYGTVTTISSLLYNQNYMITQKPSGSNSDLAYFQTCLQKGDDEWNKVKYLFSVEGEDLALKCSLCVPPGRKAHWKKVTLEGEKEDVSISLHRMIIDRGQTLLLKSLEPDLSSYYCYWEDDFIIDHVLPVVATLWTVETVPVEKLEKISVRQWQRTRINQALSHDVSLFGGKVRLDVSLTWKNWSDCSKCGIVGKRYKTGFCSIKSLAHAGSSVISLTFYKAPISCSLLLDLHPEAISDGVSFANFEESQKQMHDLGRKHIIMVGFCKKSICNGKESTSVGYPVRKNVFKEFPSVNTSTSLSEISEETVGGKRVLFFMRSLVKGIPIGWKTLPEMIALVLLLGLQVYVIYLICRGRKVAKNG